MDTALLNGDFLCDSRGFPIKIFGTNELLQRVFFRLSIKKGSFIYDRNLGSELYKLNIYEENIESKAMALIKEALIDMENVIVKDVLAELIDDTSLKLDILLSLNNELKDVVIIL